MACNKNLFEGELITTFLEEYGNTNHLRSLFFAFTILGLLVSPLTFNTTPAAAAD